VRRVVFWTLVGAVLLLIASLALVGLTA